MKRNEAENKLRQFAGHYLKVELMKARLAVFSNESGEEGIDFVVKTKTGKYLELALQTLNLETTERGLKIPKSDWNYELPENLLVALVLFMKEMEPKIYLIPCSVFKNPNQLFIDNDLGENQKHLSNWEIKVFTKGIAELSKYALANSIKEFE